MRRVARAAVGWIPKTDPMPWLPFGDPSGDIPKLREYAEEAGRDPDALQVVSVLSVCPRGEQEWIDTAARLRDSGVTHLRIDAPAGLPGVEAVAQVVDARARLVSALGSKQ
jgi:alkanesulfonate monooxygenase SsuD/methylene tetrahydromethanopterin reductase-like flavin-dependent oxidoreductase (luciferase family)